jgi:hypothetical protein
MKKFFCTALLILIATVSVFAQPSHKEIERIRAIKAAFLTDRLDLSSSQAERFFPIYRSYENEQMGIRKDFFEKYRDADHNNKLSDEAISKQYIEDNLDYQEDELAIKRKYKDEFLKVISAQQLADLYKAERDFKRMLLNRMKEKHPGMDHDDRGGRPPMR